MAEQYKIKDFRLNKAMIDTFLQLYFLKMSKTASEQSGKNVEYRLNKKVFIEYGEHQNAQEVNNLKRYDTVILKFGVFADGVLTGTDKIRFKLSNFNYEAGSGNMFAEEIYYADKFSEDADYYSYMYELFGERYKTALLDFLQENYKNKLKLENDRYQAELQRATRSSKSNNLKAKAKKLHQYNRDGLKDWYESRIDFANVLGETYNLN